MLPLNLPSFPIKVTSKNGKNYVMDLLRNKYVALTPEEWVRQHFVNYLISEKGYPRELLANEVSIRLNNTAKRCDTVVYDLFLTPLIVVEYKSPNVTITNAVFDQIVRYNMVLQVKYLIVSNGINHYCCRIDREAMQYEFLQTIPEYSVLEK